MADLLDKQGELPLAGEVRQFAKSLPPVLSDRERIATQLIRHVRAQRPMQMGRADAARERMPERTR